MPRRPTPDRLVTAQIPQNPIELRQQRVDQFLQTRSLSISSQKAYQQDFNRFMRWSDLAWEAVTPRQIALFKADLLNEQRLALATVNRVLTTLKNFYGWMAVSNQIQLDPTATLTPLKLEKPEAQALSEAEVATIYQAAAIGKFPFRDPALVSVLLHGLRVEEIAVLNLEHYDGTQIWINQTSQPSQHLGKSFVPLDSEAIANLDRFLDWRQQQGLLNPENPLFLSYSRRSYGQRLTYWGIRDVIDAIKEATQIDLHPQRFRQTFTSSLIQQGMTIDQAMLLTRHKLRQSFKRDLKLNPIFTV
jgi:integrase/recombinase XerD